MTCAFRKVTVQPGVQAGEYCVSWTLNDPTLINGQVFVYRSFDSSNWGDPINFDAPVQGSTYFIDRNVELPTTDDTVFYRLTLFKDGVYHDSPIGGLYNDLTPHQQGLVRRIMNMELQEMRNRDNGYRALLYKPLVSGTPCPDCQDVGLALPTQTSRCPTCYGTRFVGGYADPVETWIRRTDTILISRSDQAGGAGVDDTGDSDFRGLAFPLLRTHDVLVVPADGSRWTVCGVQPALFRGIVPIAVNFKATNMVIGDIRQNLPSNV